MITTGLGVATSPAGEHDQRYHPAGSAAAQEYLGLAYHGPSVTHLDALSHMFWQGKYYNGRSSDLVSSRFGATSGAVTEAREGIISRGVLIDVARHRQVPWLAPGEAVTPAELDHILARQGSNVRGGDVVILRTGHRARLRSRDDRAGSAGWHPSALPWLAEREVAAVASDASQEALPNGYARVPLPIHTIGQVAMGLWLIDNCDLEQLGETASKLRRWEFLFMALPLRFAGATGSPVNPVAVF